MDLPARIDDENERGVDDTADDEGYRYLQRTDGSWSLVGEDGWEIEFADLDADVMATIVGALALMSIDVDPISVVDNEIG